jgi:hypothetical protein
MLFMLPRIQTFNSEVYKKAEKSGHSDIDGNKLFIANIHSNLASYQHKPLTIRYALQIEKHQETYNFKNSNLTFFKSSSNRHQYLCKLQYRFNYNTSINKGKAFPLQA